MDLITMAGPSSICDRDWRILKRVPASFVIWSGACKTHPPLISVRLLSSFPQRTRERLHARRPRHSCHHCRLQEHHAPHEPLNIRGSEGFDDPPAALRRDPGKGDSRELAWTTQLLLQRNFAVPRSRHPGQGMDRSLQFPFFIAHLTA